MLLRFRRRSLEPAANPAHAQCLAKSPLREGRQTHDDDEYSLFVPFLPIYTGVLEGSGCSRIDYSWGSLLIGPTLPFLFLLFKPLLFFCVLFPPFLFFLYRLLFSLPLLAYQ